MARDSAIALAAVSDTVGFSTGGSRPRRYASPDAPADQGSEGISPPVPRLRVARAYDRRLSFGPTWARAPLDMAENVRALFTPRAYRLRRVFGWAWVYGATHRSTPPESTRSP